MAPGAVLKWGSKFGLTDDIGGWEEKSPLTEPTCSTKSTIADLRGFKQMNLPGTFDLIKEQIEPVEEGVWQSATISGWPAG